ncbi:alpha/beta fold hydrolase [Halostagnicola bangensis]
MYTDASLLSAPTAESTYRDVNGVRLHVVAAGDEDDPLVVLLHGFPEFFYGWQNHVEPLVDAGYRVLVPDQRGYNLSEKPDGVRAYRKSELARDIVELVHSEGRESAQVVGHDWGASVAWELALRYPATVDRLGIINVPHPDVLRHHILRNPSQLKKSWYVFYFQLPRIPEWSCSRNDFAYLARALRANASPGTFTDEDIEHYRAAWSQPGALTATINWYRAAVRHAASPPREIVTAPTLVVWGEQDFALEPEMAPESLAYCEDGRLERFPDTGHWVPHEEPEAVSELLLEHLSE